MFCIKSEHIRRVSFISRVYPKVPNLLGVDLGKTNKSHRFDGELFCGGRSKNKDLLSFFGFISHSQRGASTHAQLPLFRRCLNKLVNLVEAELEKVGAHQVLMPTLIPKKLWQDSKRTERQQDAFNSLYQLSDKAGNELLLGPTFEESITQLVGDLEPLHEHELPLLLYQTSPKFRYEPNPRFGLLRSNEFLMNDLYSFDISLTKARETYDMISEVYDKMFKKLNLNCIRFESNPGDIGGNISHEYQLPVSSGEDTVIRCRSCNYSYNIEMFGTESAGYNELSRDKCLKCYSTDLEQMQTLELGHTFLLSDTYTKPMNVSIKGGDGRRKLYEMGCYGLGLTRILGAGLDLFSIVHRPSNASSGTERSDVFFTQMRWPSNVEPYRLGIVSPAKRSKQFQGGSSEFIENLVSRILSTTSQSVDILIEDRDKDGIFKRLAKLQCLGIPNILVVGKKFLESPPQFEVLKMSQDKKSYEQHWLTEEQLYDYFTKEL